MFLAVVVIPMFSGCGNTRLIPRAAPKLLYRVPSGSMEPTLGVGARVIVSPGAPRLGEIVVFHPPEAAEQQQCEPECNFPTPIKISREGWYMLGDNRGESDDSRFYGAIPASWIVGIVTGCAPPDLSNDARSAIARAACDLPRVHG